MYTTQMTYTALDFQLVDGSWKSASVYVVLRVFLAQYIVAAMLTLYQKLSSTYRELPIHTLQVGKEAIQYL